VVSETVEQRAGEPLGAEDGRPLLEWQIGGDDGSRTFIVMGWMAPAPGVEASYWVS
jgi:hypothetical protein